MPKTFKQGVYKLRHPEKYIGDPNKVVFRSSWELEMHRFLDNNAKVLRWSSEELSIPYVKPTTGRVHRYFPDYFVEYENAHGEIVREIIEVKPSNQVDLSGRKRLSEYEKVTYAVNKAKWIAAQQFCDKRGIKFSILTERQLFKG